MKLPSMEEMLKWLWESFNLLIEDIVKVMEWVYAKLSSLLSEVE